MGDALQKGARVELHGLVSAASLNGMSAEIVGKKENGRLMVVVLPARERSVAVRPENVQLLPAADGTWTPGQAEGRREADGSYTPAWHVHSQEMTRAAEESMARASIDDQD